MLAIMALCPFCGELWDYSPLRHHSTSSGHSIVSTQDQISLALSVNKRKGTMFRALRMNACMQACRERCRLLVPRRVMLVVASTRMGVRVRGVAGGASGACSFAFSVTPTLG